MPTSFDIVSHETKQLMERWKGQVKDLLTRRGYSVAEISHGIPAIEKKALELALKFAVEDWEKSGKPCSAEEFVQQFLRLTWAGATQKEKYPFPCTLTAPSGGPPMSPEFLEAIHMTEEEVLASVKTATSPSKMPNVTAAAPSPLAQKGDQASPNKASTLGKRKNDESEANARKHRRGNEGQRMPAGSPQPEAANVEWSGIYLTDEEAKLMNTNLMNVIWNIRVGGELKSDHGAGVFQVRILKEKAWVLLGRDITTVFRLMTQWRPVRLYTYDWGPCLHVGLWVKKSQTQGQKGRDMHYAMVDLFRTLWQWSLQALDNGEAESLADFLAGCLGA